LIYNAALIPLAVLGWLPAWLAGLGMAFSSLWVIGYSLRLSRALSGETRVREA
jgi:Cu2+-exporting ATPase